MNCEMCKTLLVEYLYNELDEKDLNTFEAHIKKCKDCRRELAELQGTTKVLRHWQDFDPKLNLVFVQERRSFIGSAVSAVQWKSARARKIGLGLAAGLASALLLLALFNTRISIRDGNFEFSTSLFKPSAPRPSTADPITAAALSELQQANLLLMQRLIQDSEDRQRQAISHTLSELLRSVDYQRNVDMHLFGQGLEEVHVNTLRRLERTDQKIDAFIRYLSQEGSEIKR